MCQSKKKVLDNIFMLIYNVRVHLEYLRKVAFGVSGKEMLCLGWEQCSGLPYVKTASFMCFCTAEVPYSF